MNASRTALILFAHGSSIESANDAVREVAALLASRVGGPVEAAFLESCHPDLPEAIRNCARRGDERVVVIPYFLTLGLHLQRDLPKLIREASAEHQNLRVDVAPPLDGHPAMIEILLDRATTAIRDF